jgi:hypothetical protein
MRHSSKGTLAIDHKHAYCEPAPPDLELPKRLCEPEQIGKSESPPVQHLQRSGS